VTRRNRQSLKKALVRLIGTASDEGPRGGRISITFAGGLVRPRASGAGVTQGLKYASIYAASHHGIDADPKTRFCQKGEGGKFVATQLSSGVGSCLSHARRAMQPYRLTAAADKYRAVRLRGEASEGESRTRFAIVRHRRPAWRAYAPQLLLERV